MTFEAMWRDLAPIGRSASSGGYFRQPWASAELELRAWFREQAAARGLAVHEDPFGNLVAWWGDPASGGDVLTGSHLDSVLDGGAYDGPLGVVSALAAIDLMRERGVEPARPLGVGVFVEEEGSRFGRACLGSRLATGAAAWEDVAGLTDRDGVRLGDLVTGGPPTPWLQQVGQFVELHVEQGRGLVDRSAPVGVASGIWPHGRWRFDVTGRADHAGTTRMEDRADPMLTYAMTALAANKQARLAGQRATFGRIEAHPNGTNAVPSRVTAWLDARADSDAALADLVAAVEKQAAERAERDGTRLDVTAESVTGEVSFDPPLTAAVAADLPVLPTQAGHDAGVLQAAGIPSAMLFVRNPTGVSHSPEEFAETADCEVGVEALATALTRLVS
ncbi:allantoate amidohydrolase [Nocardioides sp. HM23]|uniref:allantoate amidohydrolase n=1 Tax=Nocardioides bizhenqiangii TaxID=3095076 RepID=UPI002ACA45EE|nr:allantoate amidohydrolase [Nocardioides sp. HM23]MDZ5622297.1 allantoate amidohydrolase [Nocardioides sp. HM23]